MKTPNFIVFMALLPSMASAQAVQLGTATAKLEAGVLTLSTGSFTRTYNWNNGAIIGTSIKSLDRPPVALSGTEADWAVPGLEMTAISQAVFKAEIATGDPITPDHVRTEINCTSGRRDGAPSMSSFSKIVLRLDVRFRSKVRQLLP